VDPLYIVTRDHPSKTFDQKVTFRTPPSPCPTSSVWKTSPTPRPWADVRIVSRVNVRNSKYFAIRMSVYGVRGLSDYDTDSATTKLFAFLDVWWTTPLPSVVVYTGPPFFRPDVFDGWPLLETIQAGVIPVSRTNPYSTPHAFFS